MRTRGKWFSSHQEKKSNAQTPDVPYFGFAGAMRPKKHFLPPQKNCSCVTFPVEFFYMDSRFFYPRFHDVTHKFQSVSFRGECFYVGRCITYPRVFFLEAAITRVVWVINNEKIFPFASSHFFFFLFPFGVCVCKCSCLERHKDIIWRNSSFPPLQFLFYLVQCLLLTKNRPRKRRRKKCGGGTQLLHA